MTRSVPLLKPNPKPGSKRPRAEDLYGICILCGSDQCREDKSDISEDSWTSFQRHAEKWIGLDRFGDVHDWVSWGDGPRGVFYHDNCRKAISGARQLEQVQKRLARVAVPDNNTNEVISHEPESCEPSRPSRASIGFVHDKKLCVWCMLPHDNKHRGTEHFTFRKRRKSYLHLIETTNAWTRFKSHTVHLTDPVMRLRIIADPLNLGYTVS